jgi:hypothetical protein
VIISTTPTINTPFQPSTAQAASRQTEKPQASTTESDNKDNKTDNTQADQQQRAQIAELANRDREVRAHELAHVSVGGRYAGAASFSYERGPDGRLYATGGEVSIDASAVPNDPQATLEKATVIQRAALAPADPSNTDRRVAAEAAALAAQARIEISTQRSAESSDAAPDQESNRLNRQIADSGAVTDSAQQGSILDLQV